MLLNLFRPIQSWDETEKESEKKKRFHQRKKKLWPKNLFWGVVKQKKSETEKKFPKQVRKVKNTRIHIRPGPDGRKRENRLSRQKWHTHVITPKYDFDQIHLWKTHSNKILSQIAKND